MITLAHDLPSAQIDPDVQEAHSRRYSDGLILALPLESGRFAILDAQHGLVAIADSWDEVRTAGVDLYKLPPPRVRTREPVDVDISHIDLSDLEINI